MHSSTIKKMKTSLNEVVNYHLKINDIDYSNYENINVLASSTSMYENMLKNLNNF